MLKPYILFYSIIAMASTLKVSAQENVVLETLFGKLATYANVNAPEKAYLQTDKDLYTNGETIWFKTYVLNGITHTISDKSKVVYVELVDMDQSIIAQRKLFIGQDGACGDISIPDDIEEGSYLLRTYTKYMLNGDDPNLFEKEIDIWQQKLNAIDISKREPTLSRAEEKAPKKELSTTITTRPIIQFFPEGGDMVEGLESVLGLKVTDEKGNGIAIQGKIIDQNGKLMGSFRSFEFGLARTYFKAVPNTKYYAEIQIEGKTERYTVPDPLSKGYSLQILNRGDYLRIRVSTNGANGLKGLLLLGHLRGDLILKQFLGANDENAITVKLLTSKLRDGVAQFTLFAPNGEPVCERLVFVENPKNDIRLSLNTDKRNYSFREKVDVSLDLADSKGRPLEGDFSMSVVTEKGLKGKPESMNSWLLLNSDLGGTVEDPTYFFDPTLNGRQFLLDLLMLTHGWRRFRWQSFTKKGVSKALAFQPEKGIVISGKTTAFDNPYQPKKAKTTLSILAQDILQEKNPTNAQGKFSFGPYFFQDSVETIINAESIADSEKNKKQLAIYVDPPFPKIQIKNPKRSFMDRVTMTYAKPYLKEAQLQKLMDLKYDPKVTKLKEVVVKSKPETREQRINKELNTRTLYGQARDRLFPDSIPWMQNNTISVLEILRLVPGVQIFGSIPNQLVQIRGAANFSGPVPPLFLLDGMPVDADFIQTIPVLDVLFVDVLKGADAAIYGSRASGGVIGVYTKRGENFDEAPTWTPGVFNAKIPGFYKARQFYAPNYAEAKPENEKPDHRLTLLWDPALVVRENGRSKLNFFTGDTAGEYVIRVEGITYDGRPVSKIQKFNVGVNSTH